VIAFRSLRHSASRALCCLFSRKQCHLDTFDRGGPVCIVSENDATQAAARREILERAYGKAPPKAPHRELEKLGNFAEATIKEAVFAVTVW
jgi:hypothetical protein